MLHFAILWGLPPSVQNCPMAYLSVFYDLESWKGSNTCFMGCLSFWICRCSWLESQMAPFWQVGLGKKGAKDAVGKEEGLDVWRLW